MCLIRELLMSRFPICHCLEVDDVESRCATKHGHDLGKKRYLIMEKISSQEGTGNLKQDELGRHRTTHIISDMQCKEWWIFLRIKDGKPKASAKMQISS